ncbi:glycine zipper family protein [Pseudoxanthomonas sp. UTMC 1351]|uniref:glycine zipper family protein n=1 Tax=Pseudoxanthomonas sp. UTMC 1351 TaxID=2695853 RepID=UPI0034CF321F
MRNSIHTLIAVALLGWAAMALAQKPSAYPAKAQTPEQQNTDDGQCLAWAKQDTGIDPAAVAAMPSPPTGPKGERLVGAVRGAAGGAVIGEIVDDDSSKGAAVGATAGVMAGGRWARQSQGAQKQQAQATQTQTLDTYYRAYGACMQGRGYTVN